MSGLCSRAPTSPANRKARATPTAPIASSLSASNNTRASTVAGTWSPRKRCARMQCRMLSRRAADRGSAPTTGRARASPRSAWQTAPLEASWQLRPMSCRRAAAPSTTMSAPSTGPIRSHSRDTRRVWSQAWLPRAPQKCDRAAVQTAPSTSSASACSRFDVMSIRVEAGVCRATHRARRLLYIVRSAVSIYFSGPPPRG